MPFDHEYIEKKLEETNRMIEDVDRLMNIALVENLSDVYAKALSERISLAGIKGKLEYMLTVF